uniref:Phosphodiesterase n=1 Tax=Strix occidentalis caurina TaxID=311401 RepID=A0A8D0KVV2_STROC
MPAPCLHCLPCLPPACPACPPAFSACPLPSLPVLPAPSLPCLSLCLPCLPHLPLPAAQDALLSLGAAIEVSCLRDALRHALVCLLPRVEHVYIYLLDGDTRLVCDDPPHELPPDGKLRDAVRRQKRVECGGLPPAELPGHQLGPLAAPLASGTQVLIIPLVDADSGAVVCVILVHCGQLSDSDEQNLRALERHVSDPPLPSWAPGDLSPLPEKAPDTGYSDLDCKILQLCGELYDLDAASLQLKVINYVSRHPRVHRGAPFYFKKLKKKKRRKSPKAKKLLKDLVELGTVRVRFMVGLEELQGLFPDNSGFLGGMEADEHKIQHCFCYTSTVLTSTLAFQKEQKLKCECQALLQVAKNLFTHLDDVSVLLQEIITEARNLSNAEMHGVAPQDTGTVLAPPFLGTGVSPVCGHDPVPPNMDSALSPNTWARSCPPVHGPDPAPCPSTLLPEVIGVAELVNKINGPWFSKFDEDLATAFSIYCGISIAHSLLYKKVNEAQYRSHLANEMMMYHMKVSDDEYTKLLSEGIQPVSTIDPNFASFTYTPRSLPEDDTSMAILSMLQDMNFINNYKMDRQTLTRFCLMVKKGYRDPPYHNWMHAFSVSHFCYLLYKNLELVNYLEDIEIFALFISCMCHDLDHRGTNNSFQVASKSVLAALYSSEGSVMERHHFAQAIAILNSQGCNIFDHFSRKDYQRMLDLMRDIILATDLAHHLRIFKDLQKMAEVGYDAKNKQHRSLLLCLLMTSCDLSDQTKGWKTTRKIAELIYKEFFSQGDLEKAMGNRPLEMMDREKAYIPELQISFMEHIAMPIYKPGWDRGWWAGGLEDDWGKRAAELYERVASNREQWTKVSHKFTIRGLPSNNSLDFLDEEYDPQAPDPQFNGCLEPEGGQPEAGAE